MSDGRLHTLRKADPAEIEAAQKRYQLISDTIDDTVSKLQKIVSAGEEALRGEWVKKTKEDAESLQESLGKAAVRYRDVATEIKKYEPDLDRAIAEVDAAERAEEDGSSSLNRANAMPDPQKDAEGNISPEEQQKATDKQRAQDDANAQITAAKNRLTGALDALDVAGKRLGDAVNCKNYDDGLTDKINWRVMAIFKMISKIFGIIAMVLTALAILIPGVGWLALAGVVAGAVTLIADSVLLGGGDGSVLAVVLGALGLGFAGLGAAFGAFGKTIESIGKFVKTMSKIKFNPNWRPGQSIELFDFSRPLAIGSGRPGWFDALSGSMNKWFGNGFGGMMKTWWDGFIGMGPIKDLSFLKNIPLFGGAFGRFGGGLQGIFATWGGLNQGFAFAAGLLIAGLQATEHHSLEGA
ncbi:hypothetical protein AB0M02_18215 [Actinoplanes sp. NPDC051861]|uniref:hypothetical protein n=1 Tax=Actinoplanes sp. NPDC051861 TaxID=3155170 RepID=UPI003428AA12